MVIEDGKQYLYINVYFERRILKVDYETGKVVKEIDALNMIQNQQGLKHDEVVNGIAYNPGNKIFLLTGKNWANFYQMSFF